MFLVNLKITPFLLIGSIIHLIEDRRKKIDIKTRLKYNHEIVYITMQNTCITISVLHRLAKSDIHIWIESHTFKIY